jgi:dolichol-phosphate mannosyltransferase
MKIAVVIPCYKVKQYVLDVISSIGQEVGIIYCVDDACPENSGNFIAMNVKDPRVRVMYHSENQGVGGAVISGYRAALGDGADIIVKIDGDGQMDPALIPKMVLPIIENMADYTKGNRFFLLKYLKGMPIIRKAGNAALSLISKFSTGYWDIFDPTNGYTAIAASMASELQFDKISRRYFFESDMLFQLNILRAVVKDVPIKATFYLISWVVIATTL